MKMASVLARRRRKFEILELSIARKQSENALQWQILAKCNEKDNFCGSQNIQL